LLLLLLHLCHLRLLPLGGHRLIVHDKVVDKALFVGPSESFIYIGA
jgi:hypothetical protein